MTQGDASAKGCCCITQLNDAESPYARVQDRVGPQPGTKIHDRIVRTEAEGGGSGRGIVEHENTVTRRSEGVDRLGGSVEIDRGRIGRGHFRTNGEAAIGRGGRGDRLIGSKTQGAAVEVDDCPGLVPVGGGSIRPENESAVPVFLDRYAESGRSRESTVDDRFTRTVEQPGAVGGKCIGEQPVEDGRFARGDAVVEVEVVGTGGEVVRPVEGDVVVADEATRRIVREVQRVGKGAVGSIGKDIAV